jgi:predicted nucleic acid-binding protein
MKIDRGAKVMLDTNVLVEATDQGRALHAHAQRVIREAWAAGWDLFVSTQTVREYLVVTTRPPEKNGLGLPLRQALENVASFRSRTAVLAESIRAGEILLELAARHEVTDLRVHGLQIYFTRFRILTKQ